MIIMDDIVTIFAARGNLLVESFNKTRIMKQEAVRKIYTKRFIF